MRRRVSTFGAVVGVDVMVEAADEASKKDPSRKGRRGRQNAKGKWKVRKVRLCSNSSGRSQVVGGETAGRRGGRSRSRSERGNGNPEEGTGGTVKGTFTPYQKPTEVQVSRGTTSASTSTKQGLEAAVGSLQRRTSQWPAGFCSVRGGLSWVQVVRALGAVLLLREPWHGNWGVGAASGGAPSARARGMLGRPAKGAATVKGRRPSRGSIKLDGSEGAERKRVIL